MSENCELRRGLRRREKNATDEGAGHFEKPAPDARAAPPEAHESLISRETVAEVLLTGLFFDALGWVNAVRFVQQYEASRLDYTAERADILPPWDAAELVRRLQEPAADASQTR